MSKATSNAHDWPCGEPDTYGWRGEACRKYPTAASEITTLREQVEKLTAALKLSREALGEVQDLIGESHGVYGLHLNGDESPWNELEQGGKFERLTSLNEALAAIDSLLKGE